MSFGGSGAYRFDAWGTTEGTISASAGRKLWRYILLKAFAPSYGRMIQLSSKPNVALSAIISTPPETAILAPGLEAVCQLPALLAAENGANNSP